MSDHLGRKKNFIAAFVLVGVLATALLVVVAAGDWKLALILYIIGRIGFAGSNVFYDSLLPHITTPEDVNRVSALGYAVGYLGGGILLAVNLAMIRFPHLFHIPDAELAARLSFVTVAVWWSLFSIPLFKNVPEPVKPSPRAALPSNIFSAGFVRIKRTLANLRHFRQAFRFLVAYWFYNDGISTIMIMAVVFGREIGLPQTHLIAAILLVQAVGIPFSILFGKLTLVMKTRSAILIGLVVYTGISAGGYFLQTTLHFYILAALVGCVQGGTQALSRSLFSNMVPMDRTAEFFGFFDVSQKFSGVLGPLIFGLVAQLTGHSRWGVFSLVFFFVCGITILSFVDEKRGMEEKACMVN